MWLYGWYFRWEADSVRRGRPNSQHLMSWGSSHQNRISKLREKCKFFFHFNAQLCIMRVERTLLAFIDKYGVLTNQWTWLYEALLAVSMTKMALWIRVCADDWAAESAIKASNNALGWIKPQSLAIWVSIISARASRTPDRCHIHPFREKTCHEAFFQAWRSHWPKKLWNNESNKWRDLKKILCLNGSLAVQESVITNRSPRTSGRFHFCN